MVERTRFDAAGFIVFVIASRDTAVISAAAPTTRNVVYAMGGSDYGELGLGYRSCHKCKALAPIYLPPAVAQKNITSISAGYQHTLILTQDGEVHGVGSNTYGQLGIGNNVDQYVFTAMNSIGGGKAIQKIAAGYTHSLVLTQDGQVWGFGDGSFGQIGSSTSNVPVQISVPGTTFKDMCAGDSFSVLVTKPLSGCPKLYTLGKGTSGQRGDGTNTATQSAPVEVTIAGCDDILAVACGQSHVMVLTQSGAITPVYTFGNGSNGRLGLGDTLDRNTPTLVTIPDSDEYGSHVFTEISAGDAHSLILTSEAHLMYFGKGQSYRISFTGTNADFLTPQIAWLNPYHFLRIAAGVGHTIIFTAQGNMIFAFGNSQRGQCGSSYPDLVMMGTRVVPVPASLTGVTATAVAAGNGRSYVIFPVSVCPDGYGGANCDLPACNGVYDPAIVCSGHDTCSSGTCTCSVGYYGFNCQYTVFPAYRMDQQIFGMGENPDGRVGTGDTTRRTLATIAPGMSGKVITSIFATDTSSYAIDSDGVAYAWGNGQNGRLGLGDTNDRYVPTAIPMTGALAGKTVLSIGAGWRHTLLLTSDGVVYSFGEGDSGKLGLGSTDSYSTPQQVVFPGPLQGKKIIAASAGREHSLLLTFEGDVWAFGNGGAGRLGHGTSTTIAYTTPVPMLNYQQLGVKAVSIVAAEMNSYLLLENGKIASVGLASDGRLGEPLATSDTSALIFVCNFGPPYSTLIAKISSEWSHALALTADGVAYAWGEGTNGRLGQLSTDESQSVPQVISTGLISASEKVIAVAAGGFHSLLVTDQGKVIAFGLDAGGQLGNGVSGPDTWTPIQMTVSSDLSGYTVVDAAAGGYHSILLARKCKTNYTGTSCEFTTCNGVNSSSISVCSGHGSCTAYNNCTCNAGYAGSNCQIFSCNGTSSVLASVCNGRGFCFAPESCFCSLGFSGTYCQNCYPGYTGDACDKCTTNAACLYGGSCNVTSGTCTGCNAGATGSLCQNCVAGYHSAYGTCVLDCTNSSTCNHGTCSGGYCFCDTGYYGGYCDKCITNSACSHNGTCDVFTGQCSCSGSYSGTLCQNCNAGFHQSIYDSSICVSNCANNSDCNNHGTCNSGVCICNAGYTGDACEKCLVDSVCLHGGTCNVDTGQCNCTGYSGSFCQSFTCNGTSSASASVCNSRGTCISADNCQCAAGYGGQYCRYFVCGGILSNDTANVCHGRGTCTEPNSCVCDAGYISAASSCGTMACYGIAASDPLVCNSRGSCVGPNSCSCNLGYGGSTCNNYTCFGYAQSNTSICNGHGSCIGPNSCSCNAGWGGPDCSTVICPSGYTGSNCSVPICNLIPGDSSSVCSGNGACLAPNNCSCLPGYIGSDCSMTISGGNSCSGILATDARVCSGHGACIGQDTCTCNDGYTGSNCQHPICFGVSAADTINVCSGRGARCLAPNNCTCPPNRFGPKCDLNSCYGVLSNYSYVCSGKGSCIAHDTCSCYNSANYYDCSLSTCFGLLSNDSNVCNGHGTCSDGSCTCSAGYFGPRCDQWTCSGLLKSDTRACGGRGTCTAYDTCACSPNYFGPNCAETSCSGLLSTDPSVCSGHGRCTSYNVCNCYSNSTTGYWTGGAFCNQCDPNYGPPGNCRTLQCSPSTTCNNRGSCVNSLCVCNDDSTNGHWSGDKYCNKCSSGWYGPSCLVHCDASTNCHNNGICGTNGACQCFDDDQHGHFQQTADCQTCKSGWYGAKCLNSVGSSFAFSDTGDSVLGIFMHPQGSLAQTISCDQIFADTTLKAIGAQGALCWWPPGLNADGVNKNFEVVFGFGATFAPGQSLRFVMLSSLSSLSNTIVVPTVAPRHPPIPTAVIKGPAVLDSCSDLILDGTQSTSSDGRRLLYLWTFIGQPMINTIVASVLPENAVKLLIPSSVLVSGQTYSVELVTRSFLNASSETATYQFTKAYAPTPIAMIEGPQIQTTSTKAFFALKGSALINSDCFYQNKAISYSWLQISGPAVTGTTTANSGQALAFPVGSWPPTGTTTSYVFQLTTKPIANPSAVSSAQVTVIVEPQPLVAVIKGGTQRLVSASSSFVLDGSQSYDPDQVTSVNATYSWNCIDQATNGFCSFQHGFNVPAKTQANLVNVPAGVLAPGSYSFSMTMIKGDREATTSTTIQVVSGQPPAVSISGLSSSIINPSDKLVLYGSASSASGAAVSYQWSVTNAGRDITSSVLLTSPTARNLVVKPGSLLPGETYSVQLQAMDMAAGASGFATAEVTGNLPPRPGLFSVTPAVGTVGQTSFTLLCNNWFDSDQPLTYAFAYIDSNSQQSVPLPSVAQSNTLEIAAGLLPLGFGSDYNITIVATITDALGASAATQSVIQVRPPHIATTAALLEYTRNLTTNAISSANSQADPEKAIQAISSVASILNIAAPSSSATGVQQLREQKQQIREQFMESLATNAASRQSSVIPMTDSSVKQIASAVTNILQGSDVAETSNKTSQLALNMFSSLLSSNKDKVSESIATTILQGLSVVAIAANVSSSSVDTGSVAAASLVTQVTNTAKTVAATLAQNKVAGEPPTTIINSQFTILGSKEYYFDMKGKSFAVKGSATGVTLPQVLSSSHVSTDFETEFQLASFKSNPYFSSQSSRNISSDVMTLQLSSLGKPLNVSSLPVPFTFTIVGSFNISAMLPGALSSSNSTNGTAHGGFVPSCRYWDEKLLSWSTEGCYVQNITSHSIVCACNHMTDFGGFFQYFAPKLNILTAQDFANITKLNKDNMTALIAVVVLASAYLLLILVQLCIDITLLAYFAADPDARFSFTRSLLRKLSSGFFVSMLPMLRPGHPIHTKGKQTLGSLAEQKAGMVQVMGFDENKEEVSYHKKHPFRYFWREFFEDHQWLAIIALPAQETQFNRYQRITVLWACLVGVALANALTFNTGSSVQNESQWLINAAIADMVNAPFIFVFTLLFMKCRPRSWSLPRNRVATSPEPVEHEQSEAADANIPLRRGSNAIASLSPISLSVQSLSPTASNITTPDSRPWTSSYSADLTQLYKTSIVVVSEDENGIDLNAAYHPPDDSSEGQEEQKQEQENEQQAPIEADTRLGSANSTASSDERDAIENVDAADKKAKRVTLRNPISLILDKCDVITLYMQQVFIPKYVVRMRWQALVVVLLLSLVYFGASMTAIWVLLPLVFAWINYVHQTALATAVIVAYLAFIGFMYMKIKLDLWRKGLLKNWTIPRILAAANIVFILVLAVVGVIITVLPIALSANVTENMIIQLVIVDVGLMALALLLVVLLVFSMVKPNATKVINKKEETVRKKLLKSCKPLAYLVLLLQALIDRIGSKYWFPWFFQVIPYALCWAYAITGSYFLVLYGIKFDEQYQTPQWLKGSGADVAKDIFVNTPVLYIVKGLVMLSMFKLLEVLFFPNRGLLQTAKNAAQDAKDVLQEQRQNRQQFTTVTVFADEKQQMSTAALAANLQLDDV